MEPASPSGRRLAVCADDFGLAPAIDGGIAALAERGRVNGVSCLVGGPGWADAGRRLAALRRPVERGLHLNLTQGAPISAELRAIWPRHPSLPRLMFMAWRGTLPLAAIAAEWRMQWNQCTDALGTAPDFVDGHQHVHHLPGLRELLLRQLADLGLDVAVRNTGRLLGPGAAFKRRVIEHSGGRALATLLATRGIRHNAALLGAYDFRQRDYRARMRGWLRNVPAEGALLFCHPAAEGPTGSDPIAAARQREAEYLGSDAFMADLAEHRVALATVWCRRPSVD